jgi:inosine-uridine nucleoside N-ribohydrolase
VGTARLYNKVIGERARPPYCIQDGVELYRKLLAEQPDGSVIICCIGLLSVLAKLLQSQADQYSNLSGEQLVSRKVTKLVTMGKGALPDGKDGFNWIMDKQAAAVVLNNWPVPIAVSSFGSSIMTGDAEVSGLEEAHPVHQAYRIFLQTLFARPSWDQVAVLYAVYGQQMFQEVTGLTIQYSADTGEHSWSSIEGGRKDLFIIPGRPNEEMEKIIEKLMVAK